MWTFYAGGNEGSRVVTIEASHFKDMPALFLWRRGTYMENFNFGPWSISWYLTQIVHSFTLILVS